MKAVEGCGLSLLSLSKGLDLDLPVSPSIDKNTNQSLLYFMKYKYVFMKAVEGCGLSLLSLSKGLDLDLPVSPPFFDKNTNPVLCDNEVESRKGCPLTNLVGGKDEEPDGDCAYVAFKKFISFSEFLGLPMEWFEKEVDSLLRSHLL